MMCVVLNINMKQNKNTLKLMLYISSILHRCFIRVSICFIKPLNMYKYYLLHSVISVFTCKIQSSTRVYIPGNICEKHE